MSEEGPENLHCSMCTRISSPENEVNATPVRSLKENVLFVIAVGLSQKCKFSVNK